MTRFLMVTAGTFLLAASLASSTQCVKNLTDTRKVDVTQRFNQERTSVRAKMMMALVSFDFLVADLNFQLYVLRVQQICTCLCFCSVFRL